MPSNCSSKCLIWEFRYTSAAQIIGTRPAEASGMATAQDEPTSAEIFKDIDDWIRSILKDKYPPTCKEGCQCIAIQGQAEPKWTRWVQLDMIGHTPGVTFEKNGFTWIYVPEIWVSARAWDGLCMPQISIPAADKRPSVKLRRIKKGVREADQKKQAEADKAREATEKAEADSD